MAVLSIGSVRIVLIVLLVGSLVVSAFRLARLARYYGRSPRAWFFITLFFTAIPGTIVFWRDRARAMSAGYAQPGEKHAAARAGRPTGSCPHCGAILDAADRGEGQCPRCGMKLDEGHYA